MTKAYGGDSAYADLCADPEIDICYVGTITKLHFEHAMLAIKAGKHVPTKPSLTLLARSSCLPASP